MIHYVTRCSYYKNSIKLIVTLLNNKYTMRLTMKTTCYTIFVNSQKLAKTLFNKHG